MTKKDIKDVYKIKRCVVLDTSKPKIRWKTGLKDYFKQKSNYCKKQEVLKSFDNLV